MSYLKGLVNSVQSQGGFKKWPISDVDPLITCRHPGSWLTADGRLRCDVQAGSRGVKLNYSMECYIVGKLFKFATWSMMSKLSVGAYLKRKQRK